MLDLIFETNNFLLVTVGFFLSVSAFMVIFSSNPVHAVFFLILVVLCLSSIFIGLGIEFLGVVLIVVYVGAIAVLFLFVVMMLNVRVDQNNESLFRYLPIIGIILFFSFTEFSLFHDSLSFFNLVDVIFDHFLILFYYYPNIVNYPSDDFSYYQLLWRSYGTIPFDFLDRHGCMYFLLDVRPLNYIEFNFINSVPFVVNGYPIVDQLSFLSTFIGYDLYMPGFLDKPFSIHEPTNIESFGFLIYNSYSLPFILVSVILLIAMIGPIVLTLDHKKSVKRQEIQSQIERDFNRTISMRTSKDRKIRVKHRQCFYNENINRFQFCKEFRVKRFKVIKYF